MPITDTSWLYALLDDLDGHHKEATAQAAAADTLTAPVPVVAELLQLIHYRVRKAQGVAAAHHVARQALHDLEATPGFIALDNADSRACSTTFGRHPALSYVDAVAVTCAVASGQALLTFDGRQKAAWTKERVRS